MGIGFPAGLGLESVQIYSFDEGLRDEGLIFQFPESITSADATSL